MALTEVRTQDHLRYPIPLHVFCSPNAKSRGLATLAADTKFMFYDYRSNTIKNKEKIKSSFSRAVISLINDFLNFISVNNKAAGPLNHGKIANYSKCII